MKMRISTDEQRDRFKLELGKKKYPYVLEVKPVTRSSDQNNLQKMWCGEMERYSSETTLAKDKDDWNAFFKGAFLSRQLARSGKQPELFERLKAVMDGVEDGLRDEARLFLGNSIQGKWANTSEYAAAMREFEEYCESVISRHSMQMKVGEYWVMAKLTKPSDLIYSIKEADNG